MSRNTYNLREKKLLLAQAFLIAANKTKLSLSDRRKILVCADSLENLLLSPEKCLISSGEDSYLREDLLINFHLHYKNTYYQYLRMDLEIPADFNVKTCLDSEFPKRLKQIDTCPPLLFAAGNAWDILASKTVIALVGSRNASNYGLAVTEHLVTKIANSQITVVSGGAIGIDTLAHRYSLDSNGKTCSVLGSGLNKLYPQSNKYLFKEIVAKGGLIISELPLNESPKPYHFPQRNRLIAALADALIVTEAGKKSGTLITASFAADYGRTVYAVPGSIFSERSRSCHQLIREGAILIQRAEDLECLQSEQIEFSDLAENNDNKMPRQEYKLNQEEKLILDLLCQAPSDTESLSKKTKLPLSKVALILARLQKYAYIERARGVYSARQIAYNL